MSEKMHWTEQALERIRTDEITRLTARVEELEAMLRTASDMNEVYEGRLQELEGALKQINVGEGWAALIARAALTQPAPMVGHLDNAETAILRLTQPAPEKGDPSLMDAYLAWKDDQ